MHCVEHGRTYFTPANMKVCREYSLCWTWVYLMLYGGHQRNLFPLVKISVCPVLWWTWTYFMHCGEHRRMLNTMDSMSVFIHSGGLWAFFTHFGEYISVFRALWWIRTCFAHCGEYERVSCIAVNCERFSRIVVNMSMFHALWWIWACFTYSDWIVIVSRALWWIWACFTYCGELWVCFVHYEEYERILCTEMKMKEFHALGWA